MILSSTSPTNGGRFGHVVLSVGDINGDETEGVCVCVRGMYLRCILCVCEGMYVCIMYFCACVMDRHSRAVSWRCQW